MSQVTADTQAARVSKAAVNGLVDPAYDRDACGIGAIAHLKGKRSHQVVDDALSILVNLEHRGGKGLEKNTGDGAGILFQIPHRFFRKEAQRYGQILPEEGKYAVAMIFLPADEAGCKTAMRLVEDGCARMGLPLLFWRDVPVDAHDLGLTAKACMPTIKQAFIGYPQEEGLAAKVSAIGTTPQNTSFDATRFERALYVCRRHIEKAAKAEVSLNDKIFYICSMSSKTIVYKGMLVATQMRRFYLDLGCAEVESSLALVHSRYSTNTTPSWERAHPNRLIIHNGEINTLRGNVNWIRAREPKLYSPVMQEQLQEVLPIINQEGSDSAILDNVLEFLCMNGRDMVRAVSMLLPEPWDKNPQLSEARKSFDAYQSMLMEPWDGPAAIVFTDGERMGAALDRNGLRPVRYYITKDERLILSSEVGPLDVEASNILQAGCLGPAQMLLVDPREGRIKFNDELRNELAAEKPYREWLDANTVDLADLCARKTVSCDTAASEVVAGVATVGVTAQGNPAASAAATSAAADSAAADSATANSAVTESTEGQSRLDYLQRIAKLGYHYDDIDECILPMAREGKAPLASMGADTPLPVLSKQAHRLYDYFNQLFAQVTNPPIDALREKLVTSNVLYLGNHGNILEDTRDSCRLVRIKNPILTQQEFETLKNLDAVGFSAKTFAATFEVSTNLSNAHALENRLDALNQEVEDAVRTGVNLVILSDYTYTQQELPIPMLLALGSVHNHLIRKGLRTSADIICACGDAVTPHDFATLIGYSASAIYPYAAYQIIEQSAADKRLEVSADAGKAHYRSAIIAGIVAIISKMGISTLQGYHSAQIFEICGFDKSLVDKNFTGTASRIGGLTTQDIQHECEIRAHEAATLGARPQALQLTSSGLTKWRPLGGEEHLINPETIYYLQRSCREGDYEAFKTFSEKLHKPGRAVVLRDLLDFVPRAAGPVPLDEVESVESIVTRFNTGAMSFGALSQEAHECLAIAMNRLHGRSNTGEGGEDPARETPLANGDSKNSAIKQVASGRFGVTSRYLSSAQEIQIKMAQGAKPGEGGHLPGKKVWPWVADVRRSTPGVGLISPPPHHDIYSIEDLAELIFDLKNANPTARISVKLVSEAGVGTIATGVAKGGAEKISISGANGGTGAAPRDSIYHAGLPLELGLAEIQQTLVANGLRSRVVVEADGKLMDGRDVAMAALLGAEEFGFATAPLMVMGCLMQRDCQTDTCPVGVCTQNARLRKNFKGKPEYVENYMRFVAQELRECMAHLGFRSVEEMVGHVECLQQVEVPDNPKANKCDLSALLTPAATMYGAHIKDADALHFLPSMAFDAELDKTLDATLFIPYTQDAREHLTPVSFTADIANVNRCVGTMLGSAITKMHPEGLPKDSITITCEGSGGQSFGAFVPAGVTLNIKGDANDYFGKGLSGGVLSVAPKAGATYKFAENTAIGNVAFYGATAGYGFINGLAGQRFGVRNSGATLVVEGVGNHGCEYMTGGTALILGEVGQNFAAGMSGGVAYVFDEYKTLDARCNHDMVELLEPTDDELKEIYQLIEEHVRRTQSPRGIKMLYLFEAIKHQFVKVIPTEFHAIMQIVTQHTARGESRQEAELAAFNELHQEA